MTKWTYNHCLKPEVDHLLHATRRSQCCDIFGRQTGTSLEGCKTVNAAKTVSGQYAPEWQIGNMPVVFQAVGIKTGLF